MITATGSTPNSVPTWVSAPAPGSMNTQALTQLTNPTTGETWTAPHGGYTINTQPTTELNNLFRTNGDPANNFNQPAPQATSGMAAIPAGNIEMIASGMFGGNGTTTQGTGGKGVGNVVASNPNLGYSQQPTQNLINYQPASSLLQGVGNRAGQPYVYGNLGLTSSDYSVWGSKGNPYAYGPGYNPGTRYASPINPQPIAPIAPPSNGGGGGDSSPIPDWVDPRSSSSTDSDSNPGFRDPFNDTPFNSKVFGQLYPGLGLAYGLVEGRIDNPYGEGYARLPWYEGSAGNGYGYTEKGYDQFAPGDSDRGIYSNSYDANGNLVSERSWDDSFDDYNTNDSWAQTGFFEGMGNIFGGRTWDGAEGPTVFGQEAPVASTPTLFGNPNSALAQEARAGIASEKTRVATNIAINSAKAAQAAIASDNPAQAARDASYVGTASDGYKATADRYGTTPGSEQTAMLAE